jgi:hypothetical protein
MPAREEPQRFYRWVDGTGTVHVVSSLDAVPAAERARLEEVALPSRPARTAADPAAAFQPDWSSVALGFGAGVLLAWLVPRGGKTLTTLVVVMGVGAVLVGGYLAALRRSTGAEASSWLASPSAIIHDAKATVERANEAQRARQRELDELGKAGP